MSEFKLDTSGVVGGPVNEHGRHWLAWPDLSPFEQGYVEAMWASVRQLRSDAEDAAGINLDDLGFRHLAPETLAAIRKDCAAILVDPRGCYHAEAGAVFWGERQRGWLMGDEPRFPPLTVSLGDDGKVYARVSA